MLNHAEEQNFKVDLKRLIDNPEKISFRSIVPPAGLSLFVVKQQQLSNFFKPIQSQSDESKGFPTPRPLSKPENNVFPAHVKYSEIQQNPLPLKKEVFTFRKSVEKSNEVNLKGEIRNTGKSSKWFLKVFLLLFDHLIVAFLVTLVIGLLQFPASGKMFSDFSVFRAMFLSHFLNSSTDLFTALPLWLLLTVFYAVFLGYFVIFRFLAGMTIAESLISIVKKWNKKLVISNTSKSSQ